jgi:hypothetical protein
VAFWYFVRAAPGDLRPIALREMEEFFRGRARLPTVNGSVDYIRVKVATQQRTAMSVEEVSCERAPLLADGRLDESRWLRAAGAERVLAAQPRVRRRSTGVVIDARDRFEARRQAALARWEPTRADASALRELVNCRAGWEML